MNRFVLVALALLGGSAYASEQYPLFDHPAHAEDKEAKRTIASVMHKCAIGEMSRIGPSEDEVASCDRAETRAINLGSRAATAAIDAIDAGVMSSRASSFEIHRLYDIIGRVGDTAFVEPLVKALEREEVAGMGNARQYERDSLRHALEQITYTHLKGTPAIQWRQWLDTHKSKTRDELLTERLATIDEALAYGTLDERVDAALFLASRPVSRGRAHQLLTELSESGQLDRDQQIQVRRALAHGPMIEVNLKPAS